MTLVKWAELAILGILANGCAEAAFSAHTRDNAVEDIKRVLSASHSPSARSGHAMAYLVTTAGSEGKKLVGFDLETGQVKWTQPADVRSRIAVGRGLIVHRQGESELVGRDPQTGSVKLTVHIAPSEKFVGVAVDDDRFYYVIQNNTTQQRQSWVVGVDAGGHELWRTPANGSLAAPAARGGVVAAPFSYQWVVLLDGLTGKELARIRATDEQVTFVRALGDGFYYGGNRGIYRLDEKSADGSRKGSSFIEANLGSEQVRTFYYWDGYQLAQSDYSAFDRNRLLWRAEARGGISFANDTTYVYSYRYLFALDATNGKLRWAWVHPRVDVVSADDAGQSIVYAAADGDVGVIDAKTGAQRAAYKTGLRLAGASFDAEGWISDKAAVEPTHALKALEEIVWDHDARFTAVKVFAAGAIGAQPGKDADAALLKIVRAVPGGPNPIPLSAQKRAGEELVARKDADAGPLIVDALKAREDFLADSHAVGVEVLARAAAALSLKDAEPLLCAHLADPATPQTALKDIVAALVTLGGAPSRRALKELLVTYRADPSYFGDPSPLTSAGEALLAQGDAEDRRAVEFVANDKWTIDPIRHYLQKALEARAKK
jgi:outer membrane protein assembly factor BamB